MGVLKIPFCVWFRLQPQLTDIHFKLKLFKTIMSLYALLPISAVSGCCSVCRLVIQPRSLAPRGPIRPSNLRDHCVQAQQCSCCVCGSQQRWSLHRHTPYTSDGELLKSKVIKELFRKWRNNRNVMPFCVYLYKSDAFILWNIKT